MKKESIREAIAREEAQLAALAHRHDESLKRLTALKEELAAVESASVATSSPAIRASANSPTTAEGKISLFRKLFRGRDDVYPKLWVSTKTGRKGYSTGEIETNL